MLPEIEKKRKMALEENSNSLDKYTVTFTEVQSFLTEGFGVFFPTFFLLKPS